MQNTQGQAQLVWDLRAALGEGPVWDHREGRLLLVDIEGQRVHGYDPAGEEGHRTIPVDQRVGTVVPRSSGGLVLAMEDGLYGLEPDGGPPKLLAAPVPRRQELRFNDGKCDETGRFWAGTMNKGGGEPLASLYCLEKDGTLREKLSGITTSNGLGWSPDGRTLYYIDTPTRQVDAFDFDPASGEISERRTVIRFGGEHGWPDGMTVDEEGMLWIAEWDGWQVGRWSPETGECIGRIAVPASQVTSCAFGGVDYETLYITTARAWLSEEQLADQPLAGGLFAARPGVRGRAASFYGG